MANTVDFKHFYGRSSKWDEKINSSAWDNAMVFGKIWNGTNWEYKIYAGKIYDENIIDSSTSYVYEIPSKELLDQINQTINLINIDGSVFTNSSFIEAIQNAVGGGLGDLPERVTQLEEHRDIVDSSINIIEHAINWFTFEEDDEDDNTIIVEEPIEE